MKLKLTLFVLLLASTSTLFGKKTDENDWVKKALNRSGEQLLAAAEQYKAGAINPRSFDYGKVLFAGAKDWTCGFFPGSLWYMYEITKNDKFKKVADKYTLMLDSVQYRTNTHDLGFMLYCSYGNGYRLTGREEYKKVLVQGAKSLMTRYHPEIGLIKSWDNRKNWQYPVIIDNMLNLEYLCEMAKVTGDSTMKSCSVSHANKTMMNHFRNDNSCFHVVNYDSITGNVISRETHQGYSNSSSWARGQGWALYGYTMMYRETKNPRYLEQAERVAAFILNHPRLPADKIPYWDFDAPNIPNEPLDASAAAVYASALIELSSYVKNNPLYFKTAETILKTLSSEKYLAAQGENGYFVLKHSTGDWSKKMEIDAPISYADYYYIEAMGRYIKAKNISYSN